MTLWLEELYEQQTKVLMMYDKPDYSRINDAYLKVLTEGGHNQKANVVNQLTQLKRNAEHLLEQVNADLEYPAWWVNKLVKANDYLDTAHDYLNNKVDQNQSPIQKDESVDLEEKLQENYFNVVYKDKRGKAEDGKEKAFKSKAQADKYAAQGNKADKVGGTYTVMLVKGKMESVNEEKENENI